MGVSRTAFICFGCKVELPEGVVVDWPSKFRVDAYEYGTAAYNGEGGYILALTESFQAVREGGVHMVAPATVDLAGAAARIDAAVAAVARDGHAVKLTSPLAWLVGSLVC